MNPLAEIDDEVIRYFKALGYNVSWDFSRRENVTWYEICKGGELVVQIDKRGQPLSAIIEDFKAFAAGKTEGTSNIDYDVRTGDRPGSNLLAEELFKKVATHD